MFCLVYTADYRNVSRSAKKTQSFIDSENLTRPLTAAKHVSQGARPLHAGEGMSYFSMPEGDDSFALPLLIHPAAKGRGSTARLLIVLNFSVDFC